MATISYQPPRIVGSSNIKEPKPFLVIPDQTAAWRAGDLVVLGTTGTIVLPPSVGSGGLASAAGPAASAITIGTTAVSGAPAATYFGVVTYTGSSAESVPSSPFIVNCIAGTVPSITVASAGAPAAATGFSSYIGTAPGLYWRQNAAVALGSAANCTYPLTNKQGATRGATNLSANILGLAQSNSDATYFSGVGGSITAGQNSSQLGASNTIQPLVPSDANQLYVTGLGFGQYVEFNLINTQALTQGLIGTTAGITLDSSSGFFVVDPSQSNKIFTITEFRQGAYQGPTASGSLGDLGARVVGYFNSGLLNQ